MKLTDFDQSQKLLEFLDEFSKDQIKINKEQSKINEAVLEMLKYLTEQK